jgi:hypothetical protein
MVMICTHICYHTGGSNNLLIIANQTEREYPHNHACFYFTLHKKISFQTLRVVRGDGKGTELVSGETVPEDLKEG